MWPWPFLKKNFTLLPPHMNKRSARSHWYSSDSLDWPKGWAHTLQVNTEGQFSLPPIVPSLLQALRERCSYKSYLPSTFQKLWNTCLAVQEHIEAQTGFRSHYTKQVKKTHQAKSHEWIVLMLLYQYNPSKTEILLWNKVAFAPVQCYI